MDQDKKANLKRPIHKMPEFVGEALEESGLMDACQDHPGYQQSDYIGWINRAKRQETKKKWLAQMLEELERGDNYMKMDWRRKGN